MPDPHTILSLVASAEYDWPLAQAEMTKAYELDPRNPTTLRNFGRMYFIFGKFDEGIKFTEKAVAIDPVSVNSFNYLGKARYLVGQYEASLAAFNKASELSPLS